ncbi:MAG TPA: hypothetical protein ENJ99_03075, partial [Rhizobiales bacterium]|nr:hypothetical protein [Hyphomicrobiales bacterium]
GKSDSLANFKPMALRANIKADFDRITLDEIEIAPQNAIDVRTFLKGRARIDLGRQIAVDTTLKAARFELDSVLGINGRKTLRSNRLLDALAGFLARLPQNIRVKSHLDIATFVLAGDTFENARIDADISNERIRINSLEMSRAGQTRARFKGIFLPGTKTPQLIGDLTLSAISAKDFALLVWPDHANQIEARWSGARGKLELKTKLDLSPQHVRMSDIRLSLDDFTATGDIRYAAGERQELDITVKSPFFDLDRYVPEGLLSADERRTPLQTLSSLASFVMSGRDLRLALQFDRLRINNAEAGGVKAEAIFNDSAIDIRRLAIARIGKANLDVSGLVKFDGEEISGSIKGSVKAKDPAALFRFLNIKRDEKSGWTDALAPLSLQLDGLASAGGKNDTATLSLSGSAGPAKVSLKGKMSGPLSQWQTSRLHVSGSLASKSVKKIAAIAGLELTGEKDSPGQLAFTATGQIRDGLATTADLSMFAAQSQFSGVVWYPEKTETIHTRGRLALLVEDTGDLFSAFGISSGEPSALARVLTAEGALESTGGNFRLKGLRGTAGGTTISGAIDASLSGNNPAFKAKLSAGRLSLLWLLGQFMLAHDGKPHSSGSRLAPVFLDGPALTLELDASEMDLPGKLAVTGAKVSLNSTDKALIFSATGKTAAKSEPFSAAFTLTGNHQMSTIKGRFNGAFPAASLIRDASGASVLDALVRMNGKFTGKGRTPGGLISALSGKGRYEIRKPVLYNVSPAPFAAALESAENPAAVDRLVKNVLRRGQLAFPGGKGDLTMEAGVLTFSPLAIKTPGATGKLRAVFELASGQLDLSAAIKLAKLPQMPPFELSWAGPPHALEPGIDIAALKSKVSVEALNRTMDKLEELQREQQRLLDEEKKLQLEQEEKRLKQRQQRKLLRERQRQLLRQREQKKKTPAPEKTPQKQPQKQPASPAKPPEKATLAPTPQKKPVPVPKKK